MIGYSSAGTPFTRSVPVGMPRIPAQMLDSCCYLYHSVEEAQAGTSFGGTAILVSMPTPMPGQVHLYAVSNWHVAVSGGASVLRANLAGGGSDIFNFGPEDWVFDPQYDIAVLPLKFEQGKHVYAELPTTGFVRHDAIEKMGLGVGEDVFMIGRFVDHDGGETNKPTVRFGNISAMPTPVMQETGHYADHFLLDMHSRSGYSGSPVFVYRTPGSDLTVRQDPAKPELLLSGRHFLLLLGIHSAQFAEPWEIVAKKEGKLAPASNGVPLVTEGAYVKGLSGMTCVLPAWSILQVLNMPKLKAERDRNDELIRKYLTESGQSVPEAEAAAKRDQGLTKALKTPPDPRSATKPGTDEDASSAEPPA